MHGTDAGGWRRAGAVWVGGVERGGSRLEMYGSSGAGRRRPLNLDGAEDDGDRHRSRLAGPLKVEEEVSCRVRLG